MQIKVDAITSIDDYVTATEAGRAPILPKTVVANGIAFDDPTPDLMGNNGFNFGEEFNSKLVLLSGKMLIRNYMQKIRSEQPLK